MEKKRFITLLLRGTLGGSVGGFLWATTAIGISIGFGPRGWLWLVLGYLYSGLPAGVLIGGITGTIIWLINRLREASLGMVGRATVGTLTAMIVWFTWWWLTDKHPYLPTPWHAEFLWIVLFGVAIGGLAGIVAGTHRRRKVFVDDDKLDLKDQGSESQAD